MANLSCKRKSGWAKKRFLWAFFDMISLMPQRVVGAIAAAL